MRSLGQGTPALVLTSEERFNRTKSYIVFIRADAFMVSKKAVTADELLMEPTIVLGLYSI